jgi:hypothetical protein
MGSASAQRHHLMLFFLPLAATTAVAARQLERDPESVSSTNDRGSVSKESSGWVCILRRMSTM